MGPGPAGPEKSWWQFISIFWAIGGWQNNNYRITSYFSFDSRSTRFALYSHNTNRFNWWCLLYLLFLFRSSTRDWRIWLVLHWRTPSDDSRLLPSQSFSFFSATLYIFFSLLTSLKKTTGKYRQLFNVKQKWGTCNPPKENNIFHSHWWTYINGFVFIQVCVLFVVLLKK